MYFDIQPAPAGGFWEGPNETLYSFGTPPPPGCSGAVAPLQTKHRRPSLPGPGTVGATGNPSSAWDKQSVKRLTSAHFPDDRVNWHRSHDIIGLQSEQGLTYKRIQKCWLQNRYFIIIRDRYILNGTFCARPYIPSLILLMFSRLFIISFPLSSLVSVSHTASLPNRRPSGYRAGQDKAVVIVGAGGRTGSCVSSECSGGRPSPTDTTWPDRRRRRRWWRRRQRRRRGGGGGGRRLGCTGPSAADSCERHNCRWPFVDRLAGGY